MSQARTSDRFSMGELSRLLDDDSDGHGLAEFLLKKNGGSKRPKRVFAAYKPERFSIDVRTEKIKTPTEPKNASPITKSTTNAERQSKCDVSEKQQAADAAVPLQEQNNALPSPASSPTPQPVNEPILIHSSPSERLATRRSGGAFPSADRLRRFSLKRLSTLSVGRKLLKEFDSTVTDSNFLPPICSTPMTHPPHIPSDQSPCNSKQLEDKLTKIAQNGPTSTIPTSPTVVNNSHNNTERMLNSLRQHDAALHYMLQHDSDTTIKQFHEKENLNQNAAKVQPPLELPPPSPSLFSSPNKLTNQRSRPTTPIYNQNSRPTTPINNARSRPTTPIYNQRSRPTTPINNQRSRPTTPTYNQRSRPTTPVYNQRSRPSTPASNHSSRANTPIPNQCSRPSTPTPNQRPTTPNSAIRRRTYTIEKGSKPGQVVLTPAKTAEPQQQPTSTVDDDMIELPSSPVEEAVYALHTINLDTPDRLLTDCPLLPVEPLLASPKILRAAQRYAAASKSPQPTIKLKSSCTKKSRIPLMTPAAKLKCKTAHVEIPNTPENIVNEIRNHAIIAETQEEADEEIPETQDLPTETQKLLQTLQKNQSLTPMIVIPIHQTFNHTPTQSHETTTIAGHKITPKMPTACPYINETTTTPINIEADTTMQQLTNNKSNKMNDKSTNSTRQREFIMRTPTPEIIPNEDDLRLCDIITDDEDVAPVPRSTRRLASSDECELECSNAALNLAAQPPPQQQQHADSRSSSATRSRRLRKRSTRRAQLSPLLSTETECEVGPPRAHPILTRRTSGSTRRKIPLNAEPSTPINGERFAAELKTQLARLNNHEILDLRKRNSLGKVFAISGRRKSSFGCKASLNAKQALEQQLQLEEEIQMEILKRTLQGKGEDLKEEVATENVGQANEVPVAESEQSYELLIEAAELLHTIPPAPEDFRDTTTRQSLAKSMMWKIKDFAADSSLVDDNSSEQVRFVNNDVSKNTTQNKTTKRRGRRSKKPVPEVLQKYLEVHNRKSKSKNKSFMNNTKRSLYSQETEMSNSENSSFEQFKSPPKTSAATPRSKQQREEKEQQERLLSTSKHLTEHPLPPPVSFADDEDLVQHNTATESMAVSTVAGTSVANDDMDSNLFKKPQLPAPKRKQTKKRNGDIQKYTADDTRLKTKSVTPQRNNNHNENNDDVLQSNTTESHDETSGVRRSKRGPKPLQNYWSFRSNDPTPLYDVAILERRREENKKLRALRLQNSKASIASDYSTLPTAFSTINNKNNKTDMSSVKKRKKQNTKTSSATDNSGMPTPSSAMNSSNNNNIEMSSIKARGRQNSQASSESDNTTMPTASSTINSTKKRGRPKNVLGDTDSSSISSSSVSSATKQKRLTMIQESESQSVTASEQMVQEQNLGDNMFQRLDEVDISTSETHKVSRRPQRNNSPALKSSDNVEKEVVKKKATAKATKNAKKPQRKTATKTASEAKKKKKEETVIVEEENLMEHATASEPTQHMPVHSSTAAHINDIFEKLKNGMSTADTTPPIIPNNLTKSVTSTLKKSCRVRLSRVKATDVSKNKVTRLSSSSKNRSKESIASSQTLIDEDNGSNAPSWLRDISHVGSKILTDTGKEKEMFEQMLCSQPGNLVLTDVDGLDYAYYENNKDIPFGYMRFQPKQAKRTKRARYYNLRFFVLSGKFQISTNKDIAHCSEGSVITILKGSSYSITNVTDKLAILMVFRKLDN